MDLNSLRRENFGRYKLSNGQYLRSNEFPGEPDDIVIHKNRATLDRYFKVLTLPPKAIFEMGVKEGGFLVMWSELFGCKVVGLDINILQISGAAREYMADHNIEIIHASCTNVDKVNAGLRKHFSGPINLIIDDCQHTIDQIPMNFKAHFDKLSQHGLYVVEDWKALHPIHREELLATFSDHEFDAYSSMIVVDCN